MDKDKSRQRKRGYMSGILLIIVLGIVGTVLIAAPRSLPTGELVAYLYPASSGQQNIWVASVDNPDDAYPLTDEPMGVYSFDVSADGRLIAYAARDPETSLNELWLLDRTTGQKDQLTQCAAIPVDCTSPVFRAGNTVLAYERNNLTEVIDHGTHTHLGALRIWLLDLSQKPYITQRLMDDTTYIGYAPTWSQDGNTIAFYSANIHNPGMLVYDFAPENAVQSVLNFIPSGHGTMGALSPDGSQLLYPDIAQTETSYSGYIKLANFDSTDAILTDVTNPAVSADESSVVWHPSGEYATLVRRLTGDAATRGHQLYNVEIATGEVSELLVDPLYYHGFTVWNPAGDQLAMVRLKLLNEDGTSASTARQQVWVLDDATGELTYMANDAFQPRWIPAMEE